MHNEVITIRHQSRNHGLKIMITPVVEVAEEDEDEEAPRLVDVDI